MFAKILVPIDGSECSWEALEKAIQLGKLFRSKIVVVHVIQHPIIPYSDNISGTIIDKLVENLTSQGRELLYKAKSRIEEHGLEAYTLLESGQPADVIVEVAKRERVDLIVIGDKGVSRVRRFLLGGTSDAVVHHAKCPVLVFKCK